MIYSLIRLGYLEDTRLWQAIDWIVRWQSRRRGRSVAAGSDTSRFPMCWGRHSCHMGVAKPQGVAAIPEARRTPAVRARSTS
jgi:hypothetical protein